MTKNQNYRNWKGIFFLDFMMIEGWQLIDQTN